MKKVMLLALAISMTTFALSPVASATPWHISFTEGFTLSGGLPTSFSTSTGETVTCHGGVSGSGSYENSTTGSLNLKFHNCTAKVFGFDVTCTTHPEAQGTVVSASLPFHNVMLPYIGSGQPGILITPSSNSAFFSFTCGGVNKVISGNGVLGRTAFPVCGGTRTEFENSFTILGHGSQTETSYTGVTYKLESGGSTMALKAGVTMKFGFGKTLNCT